MRLVIHAGLRKTGTTAFQRSCYAARVEGLRHGVLYPELIVQGIPVVQHSPLIWDLQAGRQIAVYFALQEVYEQARASGCDAVLLSGEDFENLLVDAAMHRVFERMVIVVGFQAPEWLLVERDPVDRLASLYSECSKHGIGVSIQAWTASVRRNGWFAVSTETLHSFMAVDLERLFPAFLARSSGCVRLISFEEFVAAQPLGALLLKTCFGSDWLKVARVGNQRLRPKVVEVNYLKTFLRSGFIAATKVRDVDAVLAAMEPVIDAIVQGRQQRLAQELNDLRRYFSEEKRNRPPLGLL